MATYSVVQIDYEVPGEDPRVVLTVDIVIADDKPGAGTYRQQVAMPASPAAQNAALAAYAQDYEHALSAEASDSNDEPVIIPQ